MILARCIAPCGNTPTFLPAYPPYWTPPATAAAAESQPQQPQPQPQKMNP